MTTVSATCVAINGRGILLRGPSGSGKSDLALRLIDEGATLVADDQTVIEKEGDVLWGSTPAELAGRMEVRGIGIVEVPTGPATISVIVDLVGPSDVERMPEQQFVVLEGTELPRLLLAPFEPSAPAKLRLWISRLNS